MLIKKEQIIEWGEQQKFQDDKQAEKDLYIEFFLNALFKLQYFLKHLVFKGGTALHKIHLKKSLRFSEDIDLEHRDNKKLKSTLKAIDLFFKKKNFNKKIRKKKNNYEISAIYQSEITEESGKLKIEISPREDFSILGYVQKPFRINNVCFSSNVIVSTYNINEILSQKTRALYQRNKGRDLYDLYVSQSHADFDIKKIAQCFIRHMTIKKDGKAISSFPTVENFIKRLKRKEQSPDFLKDVDLILKTDIDYNQEDAFEWAKKEFIPS